MDLERRVQDSVGGLGDLGKHYDGMLRCCVSVTHGVNVELHVSTSSVRTSGVCLSALGELVSLALLLPPAPSTLCEYCIPRLAKGGKRALRRSKCVIEARATVVPSPSGTHVQLP